LKRDWARFDAKAGRTRVLAATHFSRDRIRRFQVKPMDSKWAYIDTTRPLWNEPRPDLQAELVEGAEFLLARVRAPKERDGSAFGYATCGFDQHALHKDAYAIPFKITSRPGTDTLFDSGAADEADQPNLSDRALDYVRAIDLPSTAAASRLVWMHTLAIGYSPRYLSANGHGVASDWPRVPLPADADALRDSASLGAAVAGLLDPDEIGLRLPRLLGTLTSSDSQMLGESQLGIDAQWGVRQREGVTTGGPGRLIERACSADEVAALAEAGRARGLSHDEALMLFGESCFDVYLNDVAYWRCVPDNVWRYTIGGYQVIKKWLSYREKALLGRDLKPEEARYVTEMVRRIAAIILIQPDLDANYERVKADTWDWDS
jgi:hypothetical protein